MFLPLGFKEEKNGSQQGFSEGALDKGLPRSCLERPFGDYNPIGACPVCAVASTSLAFSTPPPYTPPPSPQTVPLALVGTIPSLALAKEARMTL